MGCFRSETPTELVELFGCGGIQRFSCQQADRDAWRKHGVERDEVCEEGLRALGYEVLEALLRLEPKRGCCSQEVAEPAAERNDPASSTYQGELKFKVGPNGVEGSTHGYGISLDRIEALLWARQ